MQQQLSDQEVAVIRSQVGEATPEQLKYVECFVAEPVSLFVPAVGPCSYTLTRVHVQRGRHLLRPAAISSPASL